MAIEVSLAGFIGMAVGWLGGALIGYWLGWERGRYDRQSTKERGE